MKKIIIGVILSALPVAVLHAHNTSPIGKWQVVNEEGRKKAVVNITQDLSGALRGTIIRLNEDEGAICDKCKGVQKNQPIEGMSVVWGLKKVGNNKWAEGSVLDPSEGDIYKARAELIDNGAKLKLRGFIGISLLGRTQIWSRVE